MDDIAPVTEDKEIKLPGEIGKKISAEREGGPGAIILITELHNRSLRLGGGERVTWRGQSWIKPRAIGE